MKRQLMVLAAVVMVGAASLGAVTASPILGPGTSVKIVEARGSVTYFETFRGGELAIVSLVGDGATDLDVFVYNEAGFLVAQGIGPTDIEVLRFTPNRTERYRIVVRNLGNTWNRFTLMTD